MDNFKCIVRNICLFITMMQFTLPCLLLAEDGRYSEKLYDLNGATIKVLILDKNKYSVKISDISKYSKSLHLDDKSYLLLKSEEIDGGQYIDLIDYLVSAKPKLNEVIIADISRIKSDFIQSVLGEKLELEFDENKYMLCSNLPSCLSSRNPVTNRINTDECYDSLCSPLNKNDLYTVVNGKHNLYYSEAVEPDSIYKLNKMKTDIEHIFLSNRAFDVKVDELKDNDNAICNITVNDDRYAGKSWSIQYDLRKNEITDYGFENPYNDKDLLYLFAVEHARAKSLKMVWVYSEMLLRPSKNKTIYTRNDVYELLYSSALFDNNFLVDALDSLLISTKTDKNNSELHMYIAKLYLKHGEIRKSLQFTNKALKLSSARPDSLLFRAQLNEQLGNANGAKADYRKACSAGSNDACDILLGKGR